MVHAARPFCQGDDTSFTLRDKTDRDTAREQSKKDWDAARENREREKAKTDPTFDTAVGEIQSLQFTYRGKHNAWCGDVKELNEAEKGTHPVSQTTLDLVRDGLIEVKLTRDGRMFDVRDLRGK